MLRFEQDLFNQNNSQTEVLIDSLRSLYPDFFNVFCTEVISIGPDTTEMFPVYLNEFLNDPVIQSIKSITDSVYPSLDETEGIIYKGINKFGKLFPTDDSVLLISYISGFNQSFVSLPGILAIGLDNYLGAGTVYYEQLGIPLYIREKMEPEYLAADAVRAWIMSEIPVPDNLVTLLDNMLYEGILFYLLKQCLPGKEEHKVFRYSEEQLDWCYKYERQMWEFIIENELLYSSNRLLINRLTKEAPFIKEFGQDSPGKAIAWLGFRIIESYMKKSGKPASDLFNIKDSKEILARSRYRPR